MKHRRFIFFEAILLTLVLALTGTRNLLRADTGLCSGAVVTIPFNDILNSQNAGFFCQIAEAFFAGLTSGTSATTFSPDATVTRGQMAAFITRTLDQSLRRGSRRAALNQFWTPQDATGLKLTTVGSTPNLVQSDGADLWVANQGSGTVSRVRASDGKLLDTYTAGSAIATLVARGNVYVLGSATLSEIDPSQPSSVSNPTTVTTNLAHGIGTNSVNLAFDGARIWTTDIGAGGNPGAISIVSFNPVSVTPVTTVRNPFGILFDGTNIWVTDQSDLTLKKLNSDGSVALTVTLPNNPGIPQHPAFDGTNIWVPTSLSRVYVVRAATGAVLATLFGNGLSNGIQAAFDGERILVTNQSGNSVSLWKATDLTPLTPSGISTGASTTPTGACSDGLNFWITLAGQSELARF